jgi:thioesterase domain-containing protein
VDLPSDLLFRAPTPRALAQAVDDDVPGARVEGSASLVPLNRATGGRPVYLIHGLSGQPWVFQPLVRHAEFSVPVYGARAPDLDWDRDVLTVPELVQHYIAAIRNVQRRGPYSIAGYSWGAVVAFDVATRLMRDGQDVRHLVLFDTGPPAPLRRRLFSSKYVMRWLRWRVSQLGIGPRLFDAFGYQSRLLRASACFGPGPLTSAELRAMLRMAFPEFAASHDLHALGFDDLCHAIIGEFRRVMTDERFARLIGANDVLTIKAHKVDAKNSWVGRWHKPTAVFTGSMTIYAAEGRDSVLGWQRYASRPLEVRRVAAPRDLKIAHQSFMDPPIVDRFAHDFKDLIEAP